ncbi:conserved hypothetical protein [Pseudomonas sp. 8Z]|uniref:hypothetical protein n=1 Tax=Pseudomonas sp. 8Z TaxID=2653166 RepID=UPI0012F15914|nr:hypothetical protein [Pseudomonas sp. 8Z]VXC24695.1 conserved hypothetical protein [Pseudomonas sp. 8Z]
MALLEMPAASGPAVPDPTLNKYSARQLAVATTWADHFKLNGNNRSDFLRHYLRSTATTRCWTVPLGDPSQKVQPVLTRMGDHLQLFDGQQIRSMTLRPADRIANKPPKPVAAANLISRLGERWHAVSLLTSFSKSARALSMKMADADLGQLKRRQWITSTGRHNRFFGVRCRFYLIQIGAALKAFNLHLDQELLFAIRSVSCPSPELYNWLATGDRTRRLQALRAQPILIPLMVLSEDMHWPGWDEDNAKSSPWGCLNRFMHWSPSNSVLPGQVIGTAVDNGLPLNDVLAWLLSSIRSSVRFLGQVRPHHAGSALTHLQREGRGSGWHALLAGASLGNRRPTRKSDWTAFYSIWQELPYDLRYGGSNLNRLFTGCPSDWGDPAWAKISTRLADLKELLNNLDSGTPDAISAKARLKRFLSASTYHQIGHLVDDFHKALYVIRAELDAQDPARKDSDEFTRWQALLPNKGIVDCPNGLQIVELQCPSDLIAEHLALSHCIDTYDEWAYLGHCRLVSVRRDGRPLASAELTLRNRTPTETIDRWTPRHLHTQQLRSRGNAPVPKNSPVNDAYVWFIDQVKSGAIPVVLDWPDMTQYMTRFADYGRKERHIRAVAQWVLQRLGDV